MGFSRKNSFHFFVPLARTYRVYDDRYLKTNVFITTMSENYKPDTASATGLAVRMKSLILPVLLLLVGTMTDDTQPLFSEAAEALVNVPVYIEPSYDSSKHEDNASRQVNVDTGDLDTPTKADWSNSAGSSKKYYFSWFFSGISTFTSFLTGTRTETKAAPNDHSDQRNKCKGPSCWPFRGPKVVQSSTSSSPNPQDLPTEFDARKKYETQCPKISSIKNQYNCGACWAIAVASAFSDRLCIHSRGKITYEMSSAQLLSCSNPGDGCDGGEEEEAWKYIIQNGVVTGGGYGSNEGCQPYPFGPTEKRWWHNIHQSDERTPECSTALCPITHKAENFQRFTNEYAIQREILVNGPVTASMRLYQSYYRYEKGIYHKTGIFDLPRGLHAVRIVGWGEENGIKYWRVANSKGSDWGEDGTFRIVRGINNCGIEENVLSAIPVRNGW